MSSAKQVYEREDESFIPTATAVGSPCEAETQPDLEVVAPANLPEGYTFQAQLNGQTFPVVVPMGGVEEGQKFSIKAPMNAVTSGEVRPLVPIGHWRDDLCACFGLGCCHPSLWMALCCPIILLGQVMHRLKLTWTGHRGRDIAETSSTFRILFWMWIVWVGVRVVWNILYSMDEHDQLDDISTADIVLSVVNLILLVVDLFFLVLICKTRRHIREKYQIPEQQCHGCEDCCCTYWCTCCTVAQMARHTGDYREHGARWCSETGLGPGAPSIADVPSYADVPSIV